MYQTSLQRCSVLMGSVLSATMSVLAVGSAIAQSTPACTPPAAGEYLLLVSEATPEVQAQLRQTLPPNATTTVCQYLDNAVVRVGGFTSAANANSWSQYLNELGGMSAFVARPPAAASIGGESTASNAATTAASASPAQTAAYRPQALGAGYAVLVNYFNRPTLAVEMRQLLARDIGLAAYNRNPYLLALHTTDATVAAALLQSLGDRGFTAAMVDSRRVVLLTPAVAISGSTASQEQPSQNEASTANEP
ncbi:hypothetical protein IQ268_05680 [Oculatella sp. LEGE 06141]|uniref:hypothetical protein n=1 Tax=Oculatella sp. LEGE 06141 TaxID=1828648 RepID=UPI00187E3327|nr:hypothetical protein [Oculatella sp. LEGE 06141]MBE9178075.1 hypothetical protein [Oculatella sp. LEGE 06141]